MLFIYSMIDIIIGSMKLSNVDRNCHLQEPHVIRTKLRSRKLPNHNCEFMIKSINKLLQYKLYNYDIYYFLPHQ